MLQGYFRAAWDKCSIFKKTGVQLFVVYNCNVLIVNVYVFSLYFMENASS